MKNNAEKNTFNTDPEVTLRAYAKVNLGLDIVGLREDGYHLVRMIMQSIGLYDVLTFRKKEQPGVTLRISEKSTLPDLADLPLDGRNLIVRAAERLMDRYLYGAPFGVDILLEKHIPMAAGMAGGSTDCAAALKGVAELFQLPCDEEQLREIGVSLGADVPYCLMGGTALSEGIGEKLTPLPDLPACHFIIVKPEFGASTKEVYRAYDALDPAKIDHPDIDGMTEALKAGSIEGIMSRLGNVLEEVTAGMHPEIHEIEELLLKEGAEASIMTGSGPTVFGMVSDAGKNGKALPDPERIRAGLAKLKIPAKVYFV